MTAKSTYRAHPASSAFQPPVALHRKGGFNTFASSLSAPKVHSFTARAHRRASRPLIGRDWVKKLPRCSVQTWETLTALEFDSRMTEKSLAICFVGMSNCGKSHWSRALHTNRRFHLLSVDEEIERTIEPELTALGYSGIDGMAEWMGFPSDERFGTNQARYLAHEENITAAARPPRDNNGVLDTTGSVIYLSEQTLDRIRREYLVVHLEASDDMLEFMTSNYFKTPKPVVWGDAYKPLEGEEAMAALRRCYPNLLRERRKRYAALAHVSVPASISLSKDIDLHGFLDEVRSRLR